MKKASFLMALLLLLCLVIPGYAGEASYTPGVYEATTASVGGPLTVSVEVTESAIQSVTVTQINDTPGVCDEAVRRIPQEIVRAQSANVDTVAGATLTSIFLKNAVSDALKQAGHVPSEKVPYAAEAQQDMKADVVVVGGGIAGMSAALAAAESGLHVVLLEKNAYIGGVLLVSDQMLCLLSTSTVSHGWDEGIAQLNQMGMGLQVDSAESPGYGLMYNVSMPGSTECNISNAFTQSMLEKAKALGITVMTDTPATGLLTKDGAVCGVTAQPKGQPEFSIEADAVILATGGFSSNAELVAKYLPYAAGARAVGVGSNTGDALAWVSELDAQLVEMTTDYASFYTVSPATGYYTEMGTAISHFINLDGTLITDDTTYNIGAMKVFRAIGNTPFYNLCRVEECGLPVEYERMVQAGSVQKFDTLDEIIEACGTTELKATAEQIGLGDGPYYIGKSIAGIYGTYGGIMTDADGRVLNSNNEVITGLYAAGEVMGSRDYQAYGAYSGGLGPALITGVYAGNAAAADVAAAK